MNDQDDPALRSARTAELATGFALNDLTEAELRELHDQLIDPTHGQAAARTAWQTLETVTDLRAERSSTLQDTVNSRIAAEGQTGQSGVTGRFLRRLGLGRKGLAPVRSAPQQPGPSPTVWWLIGAVLLLVLGAVAWWLSGEKAVARVVSVVGRATVGTTAIGPGDPLDGRPLNAAAEAVVTLRWSNGSQAVLAGPGTMVPSREGLSLLSGTVHLDAVEALSLGLPDDAVHAPAGAQCTAVVSEGHSCLGTQRGVIDSREGPLSAGLARAAGQTFTWQHQRWTQLPAVLPTSGVPTWRLTLNTTALEDGRIIITWAEGNLAIDAQALVIQQTGLPPIRTAHPPSPASVTLSADAGNWAIRLHDEVLLRSTRVPPRFTTHTTGQVRVQAEFTSGPPLTTAPP